jgi:hypothetical protein
MLLPLFQNEILVYSYVNQSAAYLKPNLTEGLEIVLCQRVVRAVADNFRQTQMEAKEKAFNK